MRTITPIVLFALGASRAYAGQPVFTEVEVGSMPNDHVKKLGAISLHPEGVLYLLVYDGVGSGKRRASVVWMGKESEIFDGILRNLQIAEGKPLYSVWGWGGPSYVVWGHEKISVSDRVPDLDFSEGKPLFTVSAGGLPWAEDAGHLWVFHGNTQIGYSALKHYRRYPDRGIKCAPNPMLDKNRGSRNSSGGVPAGEGLEDLLASGAKLPFQPSVSIQNGRGEACVVVGGTPGKAYADIGVLSITSGGPLYLADDYDCTRVVWGSWESKCVYDPTTPVIVGGKPFYAQGRTFHLRKAMWGNDELGIETDGISSALMYRGKLLFSTHRHDQHWVFDFEPGCQNTESLYWGRRKIRTYDDIFSLHMENGTPVFGARKGNKLLRVTMKQ